MSDTNETHEAALQYDDDVWAVTPEPPEPPPLWEAGPFLTDIEDRMDGRDLVVLTADEVERLLRMVGWSV